MSTHPETVEFDTFDERGFGTLSGTVVGEAPRRDSPFPFLRVRLDGRSGVWRVPAEDVRTG